LIFFSVVSSGSARCSPMTVWSACFLRYSLCSTDSLWPTVGHAYFPGPQTFEGTTAVAPKRGPEEALGLPVDRLQFEVSNLSRFLSQFPHLRLRDLRQPIDRSATRYTRSCPIPFLGGPAILDPLFPPLPKEIPLPHAFEGVQDQWWMRNTTPF